MTNNRKIDLSGKTFDNWSVLSQAGNTARGGTTWFCVCKCGAERIVIGADLRHGKSKSCGCEKFSIGNHQRKHGMSSSRLYTTWKNMRARCANKNKARYGGRGISICAEWSDFSVFSNWAKNSGYSENLELDRINFDGNYEPNNCRWVDEKTQSRNRSIVLCANDGRTWAEIAEDNGIPQTIFQNRLCSGNWPPEIAATWPVGKRRAKRNRDSEGKFISNGPPLWRRNASDN